MDALSTALTDVGFNAKSRKCLNIFWRTVITHYGNSLELIMFVGLYPLLN